MNYIDCLSNLNVNLIDDNQNYKLYESSIFYIINLKRNIKVDKAKVITLTIPKLILKNYSLTSSIPSATNENGVWGQNNLVCFVGNQRISLLNEAGTTANYTIDNTQIVVPKL